MVKIERGMLAKSLSGHDRNRLYIIIRAEEEYVWLVDGNLRPLEKPKKKNIRHIQVVHRIPESIKQTLESKKPLQNGHIKQIIQSESQDRQEDKHV